MSFPQQLVKPDAISVVITRHVRKNHHVALVQTFKNLDGVHRSAPNFHRNPHAALVVGIKFEQADGAALLSEGWTSDVKNIVEAFQIDSSVHAQVGTSSLGKVAGEFHVNRDGSVLNGWINTHHVTSHGSVMCVHKCRLADLNISRLRLSDFQLRD